MPVATARPLNGMAMTRGHRGQAQAQAQGQGQGQGQANVSFFRE